MKIKFLNKKLFKFNNLILGFIFLSKLKLEVFVMRVTLNFFH